MVSRWAVSQATAGCFGHKSKEDIKEEIDSLLRRARNKWHLAVRGAPGVLDICASFLIIFTSSSLFTRATAAGVGRRGLPHARRHSPGTPPRRAPRRPSTRKIAIHSSRGRAGPGRQTSGSPAVATHLHTPPVIFINRFIIVSNILAGLPDHPRVVSPCFPHARAGPPTNSSTETKYYI